MGSHHTDIWHKAAVKFTPGIHPDSVQLEDGTYRLDAGRILLKPIVVPDHARRCDVRLNVTVTSAGDPWDKSGTLFAMADKAGVMYAGQLLQWNTPYELYHEPEHQLVADFIGRGVLLQGQIREHRLHCAFGVIDHEILCDQGDHDVTFLVRPDDVLITDKKDSKLTAIVTGRGFRGSHYLYTLELPDTSQVLAVGPSHQALRNGTQVGIDVDFDHLVVFDSDLCELPD